MAARVVFLLLALFCFVSSSLCAPPQPNFPSSFSALINITIPSGLTVTATMNVLGAFSIRWDYTNEITLYFLDKGEGIFLHGEGNIECLPIPIIVKASPSPVIDFSSAVYNTTLFINGKAQDVWDNVVFTVLGQRQGTYSSSVVGSIYLDSFTGQPYFAQFVDHYLYKRDIIFNFESYSPNVDNQDLFTLPSVIQDLCYSSFSSAKSEDKESFISSLLF